MNLLLPELIATTRLAGEVFESPELVRIADECERLAAEVSAYRKAFCHYHEALYVDGDLVSECAKCGLDLRNPIHQPEIFKGTRQALDDLLNSVSSGQGRSSRKG